MRKSLFVLALAMGLLAAGLPATADSLVTYADPGDAATVSSDNIDYIGTIPVDQPGVGARLLRVDGQKRLYVTGVKSLTIYEVSDPANPRILGHLPLPNWENEDVSVSGDGDTVLISEFTGTYMPVIDTSNVALPRPVGFLPNEGGHIVSCVDYRCNWVYGSEGSIIDLRDKTKPTLLAKGWAAQLGLPRNGHNVNVDAAGIVTTDTTPMAMLDVSSPARPRLITTSDTKDMRDNRTAYQHNNLRPRADRYRPRTTAKAQADAKLRDGELVLSNGETNFTGQCEDGSGPFATYSAKNFERGRKLAVLDVFRPVSGDYSDGDPAVNALGCSGHWFTERDNRVAAGWYEHGTRILKVEPSNGQISQLGYFQPVVGSASAAHWIDDEYIYVIDYLRGIDIIRYDRSKPKPGKQRLDKSWMAKLNVTDPASASERYRCRLVQQ